MLKNEEFKELIQGQAHIGQTIDSTDDSRLRTNLVYEPDIDDLYRLYSFVIDNCVTSILEFGSGWSTFALSLGLKEIREKYSGEYGGFQRNPHPFRLCTVDNSPEFVKLALSRLDSEMLKSIDVHIASPILTTVGLNPVTLWDPVPRFDFDLIYLDAPEPEQVVTSGFQLPMATVHDLPIAGDLVVNEPYIHPETTIIIDGRAANSRYLKSGLRRSWTYRNFPDADFSIFHLHEEPLGRINANHIEFRKVRSSSGHLQFLR
jgi:hypothetical protein